MKLSIDPESSVPIYIQIEDSIHSLIAAGQIQPGEQLPTIRELAADIRVNLNTVARAYFELGPGRCDFYPARKRDICYRGS